MLYHIVVCPGQLGIFRCKQRQPNHSLPVVTGRCKSSAPQAAPDGSL